MEPPVKSYAGLDVGKSGGLALLRKKGDEVLSISLWRMPLKKVGKKTEVDLTLLADLFKYLSDIENLRFAFEDLHSLGGVGAKQTWSLAEQVGIVKMGLASAGIQYEMVKAKDWQKVIFHGLPEITKIEKGKEKRDTKALSILSMQKRYPGTAFRDGRQEVDQDGICDSLGIATYLSEK